MNTEGLNVKTQDMDTTGTSVFTYAKKFEQNLADLKQEVEALMRVWDRTEDTEAETFATSYETRAQLFNELQVLLEKLGQALSKSADYYAENQKRIRGNIDSMFDGRM